MKTHDSAKPDKVRRRLTAAMALGAIATAWRGSAADAIPIDVWPGLGCGCCHDWIDYLKANGFDVTTHDGGNVEIRKSLGMPVDYGSCHTARAAGYAIEGHVPAREIRRLLAEKPDALGVSVPAMPRGSPGMDGPAYGNARDPYDVLLVRRDGSTAVYQPYR